MEPLAKACLVVVIVAAVSVWVGLVAEATAQRRWGWFFVMWLFPPAVLPYAFGWRSKVVEGD